MLRQIYYVFNDLGFNPLRLINLRYLPVLFKRWRKYNQLNTRENFKISVKECWPLLSDYAESAGSVRTHYFHQDLWAARKVFTNKPAKHVDVGSRIDGFISNILTFMDVTVVDVRPLEDEVTGLSFICDDATSMSKFKDNSVESISTLHAAEHFGLGRYSDPIDPEACFKFMASLSRVLAKNGKLYFGVPIGRERVQFNAHRIFNPQTIIENFKDLTLVSFSYVDDKGMFHENKSVKDTPALEYGCGLFEFIKKA